MNDLTDLENAINRLDEADCRRILLTVARSAERPGASADVGSCNLIQAMRDTYGVDAAPGDRAGGELARQALLLLAHDDAIRPNLKALVTGPSPERFDLGIVSGTVLIGAVVIALQTQIEIARDRDGRWSFKFKKAAMKDAVLLPLIRKILALMP